MELFLLLSIAYLILSLIFSPDRFIVGAVVFVVFCSVATISMLTANERILLLAVAIATATALPFFAKISFADIFKISLIALIATFWLTTDEFIDGFAYSYLWVALGIVIASALLFARDNRRYCALVATLISYAMTYAVGKNADLTAIVLTITIVWVMTCQPQISASQVISNSEKLRSYGKRPC
ncbi:MAG: hypothetical protein HDT29_06205 [Clostridiales bacterium]|nr:hypothetical protein [Clostridiales bacterium]